ncbi:MAG TPA: 5'-nucleotidase C-terminal domain-containing protein [Bacillaceae bacterium]
MSFARKKWFSLIAAFAIVFSTFSPVTGLAAEVDASAFSMTIMHTNDTHAHLENVPRLVTAVEQVRSEKANTLLVDAGDVFSGTLFFNQYLGQADLEFMNALGYDAMTFGNHEFDKGPGVLADFIENAEFPFVSANVKVDGEPLLKDYNIDSIGNPAEPGHIYPAIIKTLDGEKVGIFGLTTEDTTFLSNPGQNIVFEDAVTAASNTVQALRDSGVNKIIALSHLGYQPDVRLAEAVEGIDVIVGGHSNTKLDAPVVVAKHEEPVLIVQANEYHKYLGTLDVTFDENGAVTAYNGQLLDLMAFAENEGAKQRLAELSEPIENLKKQVVGYTNVPLNGERTDVRTKETNLGNLIADSMLAKARESVDADIAMQNGGGIRASIPQGEITLGDVLTVMPFGNTLVTVDLTGEQVVQALEHSVSNIENAAGQFMQVSGIRFKYDISMSAGERVHSVEVSTDQGYKPIDLSKLYTVATNAFVADGGDGYTMFKQAKDAGRMIELYEVDYDVFTSYLEKNTPVSPVVEGRIVEAAKEDGQDGDDGGQDNGDRPCPNPDSNGKKKGHDKEKKDNGKHKGHDKKGKACGYRGAA